MACRLQCIVLCCCDKKINLKVSLQTQWVRQEEYELCITVNLGIERSQEANVLARKNAEYHSFSKTILWFAKYSYEKKFLEKRKQFSGTNQGWVTSRTSSGTLKLLDPKHIWISESTTYNHPLFYMVLSQTV